MVCIAETLGPNIGLQTKPLLLQSLPTPNTLAVLHKGQSPWETDPGPCAGQIIMRIIMDSYPKMKCAGTNIRANMMQCSIRTVWTTTLALLPVAWSGQLWRAAQIIMFTIGKRSAQQGGIQRGISVTSILAYVYVLSLLFKMINSFHFNSVSFSPFNEFSHPFVLFCLSLQCKFKATAHTYVW